MNPYSSHTHTPVDTLQQKIHSIQLSNKRKRVLTLSLSLLALFLYQDNINRNSFQNKLLNRYHHKRESFNSNDRIRTLREANDPCAKSPFITPQMAANIPKQTLPEHSDNYIPSHVQLCQELLQRNSISQAYFDSQNDAEPDPTNRKMNMPPVFTKLHVEENSLLCQDMARPHTALMEMTASSIVAYVGARFGLSYKHNCKTSMIPSIQEYDTTTIQQIYPFATSPIDERHLALGQVLQQCQVCIQAHQSGRNKYDTRQTPHHCLSFPYVENVHTDTIRLEKFDEDDPYNMPQVLFEKDVVDQNGNLVRTGLGSVLPLVKDRMNHAALDWANKAKIPSHDPKAGAVIYMDAETSTTVPFWVLNMVLGNHVSHVSILSLPDCAYGERIMGNGMARGDEKGVTCMQYGLEMKQYLTNHFTEMGVEVSFNLVSSTAAAYSRMILAHTLICLPGSTTCLLPALAKSSDRNTVILETPHQLAGTAHWFTYLGKAAKNIKVIALTPQQLQMDQEEAQIQQQYAGFEVSEVMGKGSAPVHVLGKEHELLHQYEQMKQHPQQPPPQQQPPTPQFGNGGGYPMQQPYPGQQQMQYHKMNPQQVPASSSQYEILDEETPKEKKAKKKETPVEVEEPQEVVEQVVVEEPKKEPVKNAKPPPAAQITFEDEKDSSVLDFDFSNLFGGR
ncbi:hypothetical protein CTEN210_13585 [Chaetoceros tenuissimus]|uniref:Uncharacterized protein n=1 Tax=Chaetoceros tenuissimus TaxID=426638 RepID=A0AAD3HBJ2_9STRA|nr:hypothetical protein CTEN210_13585 [Chaetoceros tenuissimus]